MNNFKILILLLSICICNFAKADSHISIENNIGRYLTEANKPVLTVNSESIIYDRKNAVSIAPTLELFDANSSTQASAKIILTNAMANDVLSFVNDNLGLYGNISILANTNISERIELTLISQNSTATNEQWQNALRAIKYKSTIANKIPIKRRFTIEIFNGVSSSEAINTIVKYPDFITIYDLSKSLSNDSISIMLVSKDNTVNPINYSWRDLSNPSNPTNTGSIGPSSFKLKITNLPIDSKIELRIEADYLTSIKIPYNTEKQKLIEIRQWGGVQWKESFEEKFASAKNLDVTAIDVPNLRGVGNLVGTFQGCEKLIGTPAFGDWEIGHMNDIRRMFSGAKLFNQDISKWDTKNVVDFYYLFQGAVSFNQDIGSWNTSKVKNMQGTFGGAESFNQDISSWNVSNVYTFESMFHSAHSFDKDISSWNMSLAENLDWMFYNAKKFNQDLGKWKLSVLKRINSNFMVGSGMSCINVYNTLLGWEPNLPINPVTTNLIGIDNYGTDPVTIALLQKLKLKNWELIARSSNTSECFKSPIIILNKYINQYSFTSAVTIDDAINLTDADNETQKFAEIKLINKQVGDELIFVDDASLYGNIISTGYDINTGVLKLTSENQTATIAQWQAALRSIKFKRLVTNTDIITRLIEFTINDGLVNSLVVTKRLSAPAFVSTWNANTTGPHRVVSFKVKLNKPTSIYYKSLSNGAIVGEKTFDANVTEIFIEKSPTNITNLEGLVEVSIEPEGLEEVGITGTQDGVGISSFQQRLVNINQWGAAKFKNFNDSFKNCINLVVTATDIPNLSLNTSLSGMFNGCISINSIPNINNWHLISVENLSSMFKGATNFNQDLGNWNVSNVTNFSEFVRGASTYNQNLSKWSPNSAISMENIFSSTAMSCANFSKTLIGWSDDIKTHSASGSIISASGVSYSTDIATTEAINVLTTKKWLLQATQNNTACLSAPVISRIKTNDSKYITDQKLIIDNTIAVTDIDNNTQKSAKVSISNFQLSDVLTIKTGADIGNITFVYNSTTGLMTFDSLDGLATISQWENLFRSLEFETTVVTVRERAVNFEIFDGLLWSNVLTIDIEFEPPLPPIISNPTNLQILNNRTPLIKGTGEPNTTLYLLIDNNAYASKLVDASGNWEYQPTTALADGDYQIKAYVKDNINIQSEYSIVTTFTIDGTKPLAPEVLNIAHDAEIYIANPIINGNAEANSSVKIYLNSTLLTTVKASPEGKWTYSTTTNLTNGTYEIYATATDAAGNVSDNSNENVFKVDLNATILSDNSINGFTSTYGTASSSKSINVSGRNLLTSVTANVTSGFELSIDNSNFSSTIQFGAAGVLESTPIYVRVNSSTNANSNLTGTIELTSSGAITKTVNINSSQVDKKVLSVDVDDKIKTYGDDNPTFTLSYLGFVNGDTADNIDIKPSASSIADQFSEIGDYAITANGASDNNYTFTYTEGVLNVIKREITITAESKNKVYGNVDPELTYKVTGNLHWQNISGSLSREAGETVNTYEIGLGTLEDNPNYNITYVPNNFTINKRDLEISVAPSVRKYGVVNSPFEFVYKTFVNGDTEIASLPTINTSAKINSNVGVYDVILTGGSDPNYNLIYKPSTITIQAVSIIVKADNKTKLYGDVNPLFTLSYLGLANGQTTISTPPNISTTANLNSAVGLYSINLSGGSDPNYIIELVGGTLEVLKRELIITAHSKSKVYGNNDPIFTYTVQGLLDNDVLSGSLNRESGEYVNSYSINLGTLTTNSNYNLIFNSGEFKIEKALLKIVSPDYRICQYDTFPLFNFTYQGFKRGDSEKDLIDLPIVKAIDTSIPGIHHIIPYNAASNNYIFEYQSSNLLIREIDNISIVSSKEGEILKAETVNLKATGGSSYNWTADQLETGIVSGANSSNLIVAPSVTTTYTVTSTNVEGCISSSSYTVHVKTTDPKNLNITNILSSNGDGVNDVWIIENIHEFPNNKVQVFDRTGKLVYEAKNYLNNWNGEFKGKLLPEGVYYYSIDVGQLNIVKKGSITIIR